jgi:putative MATE family efflux protein
VKEAKFQNDLTQGGVAGQLIRFSAPFLLSMLIQQSFSMADLLIVSYFANEAAVAAVNNGAQLTFLAIAIAIGFSVGGTIVIGQFYGAKKYDEVKKTTATLLTSLLVGSIVLSAIFIVGSNVFLRLMQVPEESFREAWLYLVICMSGLPFIFLYNAIAAVLRGLGDSKRPLYFIACACAANIILDLVLVAGLGIGVMGVAIATVVAQMGSVFASAIYLSRSGFLFDFRPRSFTIDRSRLKLILRIGIPAGISQIAVNLSFLLLTTLVNGYGVSVAAAAGLAGRFSGFAIMPMIAVSNSVAMMCAQNFGANRHDRALKTMKTGIFICIAIGFPLFFIIQLFGTQIMGIFSNSEAVVKAGTIYITAFSWDYLIVPFLFCFFGLVNGAGHSHITMINTFITSIAVRMPVAIIFSQTLDMGLRGIGLAIPVSSLSGFFFLLSYIMTGKWKNVVIHKHIEKSAALEKEE